MLLGKEVSVQSPSEHFSHLLRGFPVTTAEPRGFFGVSQAVGKREGKNPREPSQLWVQKSAKAEVWVGSL